jgi:hypothetical protein
MVLCNLLKDITADETWLQEELAANDIIPGNEEGNPYETDVSAAVGSQVGRGTAENRSKAEGLALRELLKQKVLAEEGSRSLGNEKLNINIQRASRLRIFSPQMSSPSIHPCPSNLKHQHIA